MAISSFIQSQPQGEMKEEGDDNDLCYHTVSLNCS